MRRSFVELVRTKPVQSKTVSLYFGPVRLSWGTRPNRALRESGIVWTVGIIDSGDS
jgi:hypothetical protein